MTFRTGKRLAVGERSGNGLYCILSSHSDKPLRICMIEEIAWMLIDDSRYLAECFLL